MSSWSIETLFGSCAPGNRTALHFTTVHHTSGNGSDAKTITGVRDRALSEPRRAATCVVVPRVLVALPPACARARSEQAHLPIRARCVAGAGRFLQGHSLRDDTDRGR